MLNEISFDLLLYHNIGKLSSTNTFFITWIEALVYKTNLHLQCVSNVSWCLKFIIVYNVYTFFILLVGFPFY